MRTIGRRRATVLAVVAALAVASVGWILVALVGSSQRDALRASVEDLAASRAQAIEQRLTTTLTAAQAVATLVEIDPESTMDRFEDIGSRMRRQHEGLDAIALAPDGVHTHVVPADRYRGMIGLDLLDDPRRADAARRQIAERRLTFQGPLPVVGGDRGFFGRLPVFVPSDGDEFWGFVVAVVEIPSLVKGTELDELTDEGYGYELAVGRPDGRTEVFASSSASALRDPVTAGLFVQGSRWELSIAPTDGWGAPAAGPLEFVLVALLAAGAGVGLFRVLVQPDELQRTVEQRTQELQSALIESWLQRRELQGARDHMHGVLASSPDAMVAGSGDGTITEWNAAAERLFGWTREEAVGRNVSFLVPPGEAAIETNPGSASDDEDTFRSVVPRLRADGSTFRAELTTSVVRDTDDRVRSWAVVVRDVTATEVVADARTAIGSTLQPISAVRAFADVLHPHVGFDAVSLIEIQDTTARRLVCLNGSGEITAPPEYLSVAESLIGKAAAARKPILRKASSDRALGPVRLDWALAVPLLHRERVVASLVFGGRGPGPHASLVGLLGMAGEAVAQDVVNILLYEQQLETTRRLEDLDQLKSDFLSAVSHELRTPLTAIAGFAATLDGRWEDVHPRMRHNFVRRILAQSDALGRMIDELLDYSRLERETVDVDLRPVDLRTEIHREVADLQPLLSEHLVRVEVPTSVHAMTDPAAFRRILQNLLTNAAKFSPRSTEIVVSVVGTNGDAVVRVTDQGIGIPSSEQQRIFERFYRVNRGDRVRAAGTGIGLALVKGYVEAQGGRVWVESEPGRGSTFCFTLRRIADDTITRSEESVESPEPTGSSEVDRGAGSA